MVKKTILVAVLFSSLLATILVSKNDRAAVFIYDTSVSEIQLRKFVDFLSKEGFLFEYSHFDIWFHGETCVDRIRFSETFYRKNQLDRIEVMCHVLTSKNDVSYHYISDEERIKNISYMFSTK